MKTWIPNTKFMLFFLMLLFVVMITPDKSAFAGLKIHYSNSHGYFQEDTTKTNRQVIVLKYPDGKEVREEIVVDVDSIMVVVKEELQGVDSIQQWVFKKIDEEMIRLKLDSISNFDFDFDMNMEKLDSVLRDIDLDVKIKDLNLQSLDSSLRILDEKLSEIDFKDLEIRKLTISSIEEDHTALNKLLDKKSQNALLLEDISYYPNPSLGKFSLNVQSPNNAPIMVSIRNLVGEQIFQFQEEAPDGELEKVIDLTGQPKGTYLLQIKQNDRVLSKKILIE